MKRKAGRPSKNNSVPSAQDLRGKTSRQILGEEVGESQDNIRRYIRITELIPELIEMVDSGEVALRPAVEISYLPEKLQDVLADCILKEDCTPSHDQAIRMRGLYKEGLLTEETINQIMCELKPNQKEHISISNEKINQYIPKNLPVRKREDYIVQALKYYDRYLKQQREYER